MYLLMYLFILFTYSLKPTLHFSLVLGCYRVPARTYIFYPPLVNNLYSASLLNCLINITSSFMQNVFKTFFFKVFTNTFQYQ